ncbi:MAG: hypothetical protein GX256_06530 [Fretibacterium sp.]|nr:hypothetical protein [Fretibacterium sp.]
MTFVWIVCALVFIFGLIQWARGGAVLWDIFRIQETNDPASPSSAARRADRIRDMEKASDVLVRSSFRAIGVLALVTWLFLSLVLLFDSMDLDLMDRLSYKVRSIWGNPVVRAGGTSTTGDRLGNRRQDTFKSLGSGLRR